jgi:periplasmic mercuric ion binding protein
MKKLGLAIALLLGITFAQAQTKTEKIQVRGNCGMCKKTIEKAAKAAGATKATWNMDEEKLTVTYSTKKTNNMKIQKAIAKVGYDTQDVMATEASYSKLPGCCQYDRASEDMEEGEKEQKK